MSKGCISVVGLGKLGACMAACLAHKGLRVVGVDINRKAVDLVNSGQPPVFEPGLTELFANVRPRLRATSDFRQAIGESELTFIVVPTPSEDHGGFSLKYVKQAAREVGRALREKASYHLIVLTSTVLPGSSEYGVLPLLTEESGKRCGKDFGYCYGPEFIALGSVIRDFLNPDFVLIGQSDPHAGEHLAALYKVVCDNHPPIAQMSIINAELAKIAVNSYVTMKITFANMLAALCEQLPGGDVDAVTSALGSDSRIGGRYLKGALGYGGPCFPRDNLALAYIARQLGQQATLPEATDAFNRAVLDRLVDKVCSFVPPAGLVAVLGLAYKPDTMVVEESQGVRLAGRLAAKGIKVVVYDPRAMESARSALGPKVRYADSMQDCLKQADVVVITNPNREFTTIKPEDFSSRSRPVIVDAWRLLRGRFENDGRAEYKAIGLGKDASHIVRKFRDLWSDAKSKQAVKAG